MVPLEGYSTPVQVCIPFQSEDSTLAKVAQLCTVSLKLCKTVSLHLKAVARRFTVVFSVRQTDHAHVR